MPGILWIVQGGSRSPDCRGRWDSHPRKGWSDPELSVSRAESGGRARGVGRGWDRWRGPGPRRGII